MSDHQEQRDILPRRVVTNDLEERDPKRFDHLYAIALSAVLILFAEFADDLWRVLFNGG